MKKKTESSSSENLLKNISCELDNKKNAECSFLTCRLLRKEKRDFSKYLLTWSSRIVLLFCVPEIICVFSQNVKQLLVLLLLLLGVRPLCVIFCQSEEFHLVSFIPSRRRRSLKQQSTSTRERRDEMSFWLWLYSIKIHRNCCSCSAVLLMMMESFWVALFYTREGFLVVVVKKNLKRRSRNTQNPS